MLHLNLQIQALYHHPSLGTILELVLVRLDIMKRQPRDLPHYEGERGKLLDSFCAYQAEINPSDDSDPDHWDMALYVSGYESNNLKTLSLRCFKNLFFFTFIFVSFR